MLFPHPSSAASAQSRRRPTVAAGPVHVEMRSAATLAADLEAWRALGRRVVEPNVFAHPDLLLPALQHLEGGRGVGLLCAWLGARLAGVFPLAGNRLGLPFGPARLWRPPLVPLGTPLVDAEVADEVIEAALLWLADHGRRPATLEVAALPRAGGVAAAFERVAVRTGRRFALDDLPNPTRPADPDVSSRGAGQAIERSRTAREVRDGVELFLVLQAAVAKAQGAPALVQHPDQANFLRTATRLLARARLCQVELVRVAGETVAATILVRNGTRSGVWLAADPQRRAVPPQQALGSVGRVLPVWSHTEVSTLRIGVRPTPLPALRGRLWGSQPTPLGPGR